MNNYKEEIAKLQTQLDELKSKIEKPKTIREIFETSTIDFYKSAEQYSLYDDLINYLTENKQEIIETLNNL